MRKNIKWIISILFILLFLIIALYIIRINDNIIDKNIYNIIIKTKSNFMTTFFKIITSFASVPTLLIFVVIVLLIKKYFLEEFISEIKIPVVFVVVSQQEFSSVKISNSPNTILIIWTEISNSTSLSWWNNFQMSSFINFLISNTVKINSLNEKKFLLLWKINT